MQNKLYFNTEKYWFIKIIVIGFIASLAYLASSNILSLLDLSIQSVVFAVISIVLIRLTTIKNLLTAVYICLPAIVFQYFYGSYGLEYHSLWFNWLISSCVSSILILIAFLITKFANKLSPILAVSILVGGCFLLYYFTTPVLNNVNYKGYVSSNIKATSQLSFSLYVPKYAVSGYQISSPTIYSYASGLLEKGEPPYTLLGFVQHNNQGNSYGIYDSESTNFNPPDCGMTFPDTILAGNSNDCHAIGVSNLACTIYYQALPPYANEYPPPAAWQLAYCKVGDTLIGYDNQPTSSGTQLTQNQIVSIFKSLYKVNATQFNNL